LKDTTVAAVQMNGEIGKTEKNLEKVEDWTSKASESGADLVLFPELVITGHWCSPEAWSHAEKVPDGPSVRRLETISREYGVVVCAGLGEIESGVQYNAQVVVGPDGYLGKQRKLHMSGDEYFYYRPGSQINPIDVGRCIVGIVICYDNLFPEVPRILALKGAEVILAPHAARFARGRRGEKRIVSDQKRFYRKVYASRAFDNGVFYVVTNQAGYAGEGTSHAGGTIVFDPQGEVVAESNTAVIEEEMVVATLSARSFSERRGSKCFPLLTRRPEIYGEIVALR